MRNLRPSLSLAALLAIGALALATAAPGQPAPATPPAPASPPAPAPDTASDPAVALIQGKCTACHDAGFIFQGHHTEADWKDLVNQMIGRGADVSPAESDQIVAYLAKTQPALPPPAPAS